MHPPVSAQPTTRAPLVQWQRPSLELSTAPPQTNLNTAEDLIKIFSTNAASNGFLISEGRFVEPFLTSSGVCCGVIAGGLVAMVRLFRWRPTPPEEGGHDATCGGYLASSARGDWKVGAKAEGEDQMGIAFLSLVILCVFVYLFYALFRPENF